MFTIKRFQKIWHGRERSLEHCCLVPNMEHTNFGTKGKNQYLQKFQRLYLEYWKIVKAMAKKARIFKYTFYWQGIKSSPIMQAKPNQY
jgi:hypothetical protein